MAWEMYGKRQGHTTQDKGEQTGTDRRQGQTDTDRRQGQTGTDTDRRQPDP
jgi:hypothetical protein